LRRSLEGMTSWPLVVTVETSVFMKGPLFGRKQPEKYTSAS
jgi:hypothetical protein